MVLSFRVASLPPQRLPQQSCSPHRTGSDASGAQPCLSNTPRDLAERDFGKVADASPEMIWMTGVRPTMVTIVSGCTRRTEGTSVNRRVVRERRQESPPWTAPSFRLLALYALLCDDEDRDSEKHADIGPFEQFQAADDGLLTDCTRVATGYPAPEEYPSRKRSLRQSLDRAEK